MFQYQMRRFADLTWRQRIGLALGVAVTLALAVGLIVLSVTVAIILLPIVAIAIAIGRWRLKKALAEAEKRGDWPPQDRGGRPQARIIDAEFEVVEETTRPEGPGDRR